VPTLAPFHPAPGQALGTRASSNKNARRILELGNKVRQIWILSLHPLTWNSAKKKLSKKLKIYLIESAPGWSTSKSHRQIKDWSSLRSYYRSKNLRRYSTTADQSSVIPWKRL